MKPDAPDADDVRYEIKFVAPITQAYQVDGWLRTHPAAFVVPYPPRQVNNIYFDNAELGAYAENLSGISERTKVRFRWYGDARGVVSGKLELKFRRNRVGWKRSYAANDLRLADTPWREFTRQLHTKLPMEGRLWLEDFSDPIVINRYSRRYLVSRDGLVRVTLDTDFHVVDQRARTRPDFSHHANIPDVMIVEAKADASQHELLSRTVRDIPVRVGRFSKYATGLANILP